MKILMIYAKNFSYKTAAKTLDIPEINEQKSIDQVLVGFIQAEEKDEENTSKVVTKLIKNLKWGSNKNNTKNIILHSFAHLSTSKAGIDVTQAIFDNAEKRLRESGFNVQQTPFGYFLDLNVDAPGHSQARIFKDI